MKDLRILVLVLFTLLMALSAGMLLHLGFLWIDHGTGLHPVIAYPAATVFLVVPMLIAWAVDRERDD